MSTPDDRALADFLLGDMDLARDVVAAAREAARIDVTKYDDTLSKRERISRKTAELIWQVKGRFSDDEDDGEPPRLTAHFGARSHLVQKHVIRFCDLVAWTHEARLVGARDSACFRKAEEEGEVYEVLGECALRKQLAPVSDVLLLRRYVAALLSAGAGWPDTEWLAVAVWSVLRGYPVNKRRMTAITKSILHGRRASGYTSDMRRKIREHIRARFSHFVPNGVDFGPDGFGFEHTPGGEGHSEVLFALSNMAPWGVPCFASSLLDEKRETFADAFKRALNDPAFVVSSKSKRRSSWLQRSPMDVYIDDAGRRVMYRAHALLCGKCFERVAADYERTEIIPGRGPSRTRAQGAKLRFPRFFFASHISGGSHQ